MKIYEVANEYYQYVGNCKDSFDEDGESLINVFQDVSDFAVVEEEALRISEASFLKAIGWTQELDRLLNHHCQFLYCTERQLYILYDEDTDTHYFWVYK